MNLQLSYKAKRSAEAEKELHLQVSKLERRLHAFRPELVHLHGALEAQPRSHHFVITLNLHLPSGQISASAEAAKAATAIKSCFAELLAQLRKHKDLLRKEHKWRSDNPVKDNVLSRIERMVEHNLTARGVGNNHHYVLTGQEKPDGSDGMFRDITPSTFARGHRFVLQSDIRRYINAKLDRLEKFVSRELTQMEANGRIEHGQVSMNEVIDEVVMSALSAESKPANISIERWMYRMCLDALRRLSADLTDETISMHLEQSVAPPNFTGSDELHLQFHQPDGALHREDVIADMGMGTPEQFASSDELLEQVESALQPMPRNDREVFFMLTVDGFAMHEIAHLTHRHMEDVRHVIVRARDQILRNLPAGHAFKDHLMRQSTVT